MGDDGDSDNKEDSARKLFRPRIAKEIETVAKTVKTAQPKSTR